MKITLNKTNEKVTLTEKEIAQLFLQKNKKEFKEYITLLDDDSKTKLLIFIYLLFEKCTKFLKKFPIIYGIIEKKFKQGGEYDNESFI